MSKKRDDSVFFFTLVDFLITALFFGVVLFVFRTLEIQKKEKREESLARAAGVSNFARLTDALSRLGPIGPAQEAKTLVDSLGGLEEFRKMVAVITKAGGPDSVGRVIDKIRKVEEGYGKPPCNFALNGSRKIAVPIATVVAEDTLIRFESSTPALDSVLTLLGYDFASIKVLSLSKFRQLFGRLPYKRDDCRYDLEVVERTRFVDARDAVQAGFRIRFARR